MINTTDSWRCNTVNYVPQVRVITVILRVIYIYKSKLPNCISKYIDDTALGYEKNAC